MVLWADAIMFANEYMCVCVLIIITCICMPMYAYTHLSKFEQNMQMYTYTLVLKTFPCCKLYLVTLKKDTRSLDNQKM